MTKANETRQQISRIIRAARIAASLEANAGLKIKHERKLVRMTNVRYIWGGHLADATCHYDRRWVVSGNTYAAKDLLKAAGFRWDREDKVWFRSTKQGEIDITELSANIIRQLAA